MKRDLKLIREILLEIEKANDNTGDIKIDIPEYTHDEIQYNLRLLSKAGYIEAINGDTREGIYTSPQRMTWQGHEFLAVAHNKSDFNNALDKVKTKGVDVTFDIFKELLVTYVKSRLGFDGK